MKELNNAKKEYESIAIPQELEKRVLAGIRQGKKRYWQTQFKHGLAATAACLALLTGVLNISPTAAAIAADVPILNGFFRILTVRNYTMEENSINYQVAIPEVQAAGELAQQINAAIQEKTEAHLAKAQQDWEDYKEAFFATGGTEQEWNNRSMDVIIDYEIKSQNDTSVSFVVNLAEGWVSSMEERYYYNLNLAENRQITLKEILGDNWIEICNQTVREGIQNSIDADGFSFFFAPEEGGFVSVDENTSFYLQADGTPVLVFPRYAIAAGAAGFPEFPVQIAD